MPESSRTGLNSIDDSVRRGHPRTRKTTRETLNSKPVSTQIEPTGSAPDTNRQATVDALDRASNTVKNIRLFEVVETRGSIAEGRVAHWQATIEAGFPLEARRPASSPDSGGSGPCGRQIAAGRRIGQGLQDRQRHVQGGANDPHEFVLWCRDSAVMHDDLDQRAQE